jgi:acetyl esterase/lipase
VGTTPATAAAVACGTRRTAPYADHPGSDPLLTSVDLYLPPPDGGGCVGRPLVVWVHGGGWTEGDKSEYVADKVTLFNGAGFVFASVNYRLTDPALTPPSPRYPVHDQDVADAVAWLVAHADELGVDPGRVAVLGHSAGGGIVAAISTDPRYLGAHGLGLDALRCTATLDGEGFDITVGATHPSPEVRKVYRNAFGDDPTVWVEASPLEHIAADAGTPDFFVAARGGAVRLDLHLELASSLRAAGVPTTVLDARQLTHADLATDIGAPDDEVVTPALMSFLDACFGAPSGLEATATGWPRSAGGAR